MAKFTICVLKLIIIILMNLLAFMMYSCNFKELEYMSKRYATTTIISNQMKFSQHEAILEEYFHDRKDWKTSMLGAILFQNETDYYGSNKYQYLIFIWGNWHWWKSRHMHYIGNKLHYPLTECSVNNCQFTGKKHRFEEADAVLVHLPRGLLPNVTDRKPYQRWIFLDDESPANVYSYGPGTVDLSQIANVFNWSMSYRTDSDIPVPYGRTIPRLNAVFPDPSLQDIANLVPHWMNKKRDVLITVMMSHCAPPHRLKYLNELKKYTHIDVYGRCSDRKLANVCPDYYSGNCTQIGQYLFYFVFENSMCRQYMTEKLFYYAYHKGAIPIISGPPLQDCKALLPLNSFIHVDDYLTPGDLAEAIINISHDDEKVLAYHHWRNHFKVVNEHAHFGFKSIHLCRVCEALNYNDPSYKVYGENDIRSFLDEDLLCNNILSPKRSNTIQKKKQIKKN